MVAYKTLLSQGVRVPFLAILIFVGHTSQGQSNNNNESSPSSPAKEKKLDDYYSSLVGVQYLAKQEQLIVRKMVRYKKKLEETLELINIYLDDYSESISPVIKKFPELRKKVGKKKFPVFKDVKDLKQIAEQVSGNPLMVFKLLRRFAIEMDDISADMEDDGHHSEFKKYISDMADTLEFPTLTDLNGAAAGLIRLQETYSLPTFAMGNGVLIEKKTGCKLQAADMQFIGVHALSEERFATGAEWLYGAYQKILKGDKSLPLSVVKNHLLVARTLHNKEFLKFKREPANLFSNLVNSTCTNIPDMFIPPIIWEYPIGYTLNSLYDIYNFYALCRGEQLLKPKTTKSFRCWYSHKNSPFNVISPLKVEMLHESPMLLQVYDLLSDGLISHLKNATLPYLSRSKVLGTDSGGLKSDVRTSSVAWLKDYLDQIKSNDSWLRRIPRIVKEASGLECDSIKNAEELQVSCYGAVGGYYIPHFDSLVQRGAEHTPERREDLKKGDRVATVMFYLSDVELGGGTAFPRLGVAAKAIKGSAVIWYNLKRRGVRDVLTLHGGCPVLYGNKWVANKWIRLYEQMHIRKCGKLPTD